MAAIPPPFVVGTAAVSVMMVLSSALVNVYAGEGGGGDDDPSTSVGKLLYMDCLATQNLGHAAFLLGFTGICNFNYKVPY